MPLVEGESLRERLRREGALPIDTAARLAREAADAIGHAHARGVVHRDVKPENILIEAGHAVVADFGLAKGFASSEPREHVTRPGFSVGTPAYMSPEQASGDVVDARSDVYSLGCVLYEMLTGEPPFTGASPRAIVAKRFASDAPSVRVLRPAVGEALAQVVARALARVPADRHADASALRDALDAAMGVPNESGTAPIATPTSAPAITPAVPRRRGARRALAAAAVALVTAAAAGAWLLGRPPSTASIAVLPFANIGGDTADAYFAAGMTEELAIALQHMPNVRVAARSSAATLARRGVPADSIGRLLGVRSVLEGTVRRDGARLRVSATLTDVATRSAVMAESFDRDASDVFGVQDDVTRAIVERLRVRLPGARARVASASRGTRDAAAYDLYLRGRYDIAQSGRTPDALDRAIADFSAAASRDPRFARAFAGLADATALLPYFVGAPMDSVAPIVRRHAERAIALDSSSGEPHASLARADVYENRWADAEREYRRAIALSPDYATAHLWLGSLLCLEGRIDECVAEQRLAVALEPAVPIMSNNLALALLLAGRLDEAEPHARRAYEMTGSFSGTPAYAMVLLARGRAAEVHRHLSREQRLPFLTSLRAQAALAAGDTAAAKDVLRQAERDYAKGTGGRAVATAMLVPTLLVLGDTARALDVLAAQDGRAAYMTLGIPLPYYRAVRDSPRFAAYLRRAGLDPTRFVAAIR
jgi:eukaryotic-like serine/threonine-protein kinase